MVRTAEQLFHKRRTLEGDDFERHAVHPALAADGYDVARSHLSEGPFDWIGVKRGHLVVVAARLTRVSLGGAVAVSPSFSFAELSALWSIAERLSGPGLDVHALVATAEHAPTWRAAAEAFGPCRCSPKIPAGDIAPARFLRLTAPPRPGRGFRPAWEPWTPDYGLSMLSDVV